MINRSMSVQDYKSATMGKNKSKSNMSAPAPVETKTESAAPVAAESSPSNSQQDVQTQQAASSSTEKPSFPNVFEQMVNNLPNEEARKIAIQGQQEVYKEIETLNAELNKWKEGAQMEQNKQIQELQNQLEQAKQESGSMRQMYTDSVKTFMNAVRNFYEQNGENPNVSSMETSDLDDLEVSLQKHPEMGKKLMPIVSCSMNRARDAETRLQVHQQESSRNKEERELFARMRGFQRDSAKPTYDYHGFENNKRPAPISENANNVSEGKKKRKTENKSDLMNDLRSLMRKQQPSRPKNIRVGER